MLSSLLSRRYRCGRTSDETALQTLKQQVIVVSMRISAILIFFRYFTCATEPFLAVASPLQYTGAELTAFLAAALENRGGRNIHCQ